MSKTDDYRATLRGVADWEDFLVRASGLPGPRANLENLKKDRLKRIDQAWVARLTSR